MPPHLVATVDSIAVLYALFRMVHGKRIGPLYGGYVIGAGIRLVMTTTAPGTGDHAASLEAAVTILGGLAVMGLIQATRGIAWASDRWLRPRLKLPAQPR